MFKVYTSFDDMLSSEQFAFSEFFPEREGDFEDVIYFFTGMHDWEGMYNFVINNGGNPDTDLVATIDDTTNPPVPLFLYAIIVARDSGT